MVRETVPLRGSPIKSLQTEQDKNKDIISIPERVLEKVSGRTKEPIYRLEDKDGRGVEKPIYRLEDKDGHGVEKPIYRLEDNNERGVEEPIYRLEDNNERGVEEPIYRLEDKDVSKNKRCQDSFFKNKRDGDNEQCGQTVLPPPIMVGKEGQQIVRATEERDSDLCNYCVQPLKREIFLNRFNDELKEREEIACQIKIEGSYPMKFSILTRDIKRLTVIIGDKFSSALLNPNIKHAAKTVENLFRSASRGIPVSKNYIDHGWQKIDGIWVYVHDGLHLSENIVFRTGMNLPFYNWNRQQVAQTFFNAYNLYTDKGPMSVMLAFSMLGVLYRIFDEAGYAPQFLLFVNGKTGSMKTTLSKILFIQLTDDMHRDTPRRIDSDTVTSFERGIVMSGRDTVTLIDDYAPAKSPRQKADNEEKLERIIRMVGDRSTKSRSNINLEDCRGEGVKGTVVLTGELIGKGLSSNLRCFYCSIQREFVNEEVVTFFQDHSCSFTTLIQHFSSFVGENWEKIVNYIRQSFQKERVLARQLLTERRLVDSTVVLRLTCEIVREFILKCKRNPLEVNPLIEEMRNEILRMAVISEDISLEETLVVRFVKIIDQLLQGEKLNMIARRPTENDITFIDGFYDDEFYYFLPDSLYEKVKRVFYSNNIYLPLNLDEIVKALSEEGIIVSSPNGQGKKVNYARVLIGQNKKRSFIKIRKEIIQRIADN